MMKNRTAQRTKLPAVPVPDMSELTKEKLKAEIEKGFADATVGQVMPAAEVFAELRKEHQSSISQIYVCLDIAKQKTDCC